MKQFTPNKSQVWMDIYSFQLAQKVLSGEVGYRFNFFTVKLCHSSILFVYPTFWRHSLCFRRSRVYLNQDHVTWHSASFPKSKSTSRCRVTSLSSPLAARSTSQGWQRRWGKRGWCCKPSGQWITCSPRTQGYCPPSGGCYRVGVPLVVINVLGFVSICLWM